jgi:CBS-domain-containing membrane protein
VLSANLSRKDLRLSLHSSRRGQWLYPVVGAEGALVGVVKRKDLQQLSSGAESRELNEVMHKDSVVAYPDEPLRVVVNRMADTGLTRFPVIDNEHSRKLLGIISLEDLLHARVRSLEEERRRERVLRIHLPFGATAALQEEAGQTLGVSEGSVSGSSEAVD